MTPMSDTSPAIPQAPNAPAGWYPEGVNGQRYWNGEQWTDNLAPLHHLTVAPKPTNSNATVAIVCMILTLVLALSIVLSAWSGITAIVGLACGVSGLRESRKLGGAGAARSIWAIVICSIGLVIGAITAISYFVNR